MLDVTEKGKRGRPRRLPVDAGTTIAVQQISPVLGRQIRELAAAEHRTIRAQVEILLERGLRSYSLEMTA